MADTVTVANLTEAVFLDVIEDGEESLDEEFSIPLIQS